MVSDWGLQLKTWLIVIYDIDELAKCAAPYHLCKVISVKTKTHIHCNIDICMI